MQENSMIDWHNELGNQYFAGSEALRRRYAAGPDAPQSLAQLPLNYAPILRCSTLLSPFLSLMRRLLNTHFP
jgi:hypothetical protein